MLNSDMVSRGLIAESVREPKDDPLMLFEKESFLLKELLATDSVEIGIPKLLKPDYVEFVAWRGAVEDRVRRAMQAVALATGHDKEFAYWLCLRKNVDVYESKE